MTATLSPGSGLVAGVAVRTGLGLAGWGIRRARRLADRDLQLSRLEARAVAMQALAERDELVRSVNLPY
ncbi:hypothetical protein ACDF64_12190 [Agromyces sp. MMS24-JH15]|uniref:hypothetical protein n=1 Tax=Agromyces sp. MMS24-JH15 TaxID=3243765 RepID=UPI003747B40D